MKRAFSLLLVCSILLSLFCAAFGGQPVQQVSAAQNEAATKAVSVPSISAPFTTHPAVFIVEDTYQIAFATNATGIAWVEVGGVKYEDANYGLMNWNSKYHKITVPQSALNSVDSYKICFRALSDRIPYTPVPGTTASRTYPFDGIPTNPVFYCASDQHGSNDYNLAISTYKAFDVYVIDGDYTSTLTKDGDLKLLLDMAGSVTKGRKPTIYARGNHEVRGSMSHELYRVSGYSHTTGAYYRVQMPGIFALVLDAGEDKVDSHEEYGGTVDFATYRKEQTEWLRKIVKDREWEKYPVRMVFCHVPFAFYAVDTFESVYSEWTELLDEMGISLVVSGHTHSQAFYNPTATRYKSDPNFRTVVVSDRENGTDLYSGAFISVSDSQYAVEIIRQDKTVKATKSIPVFTNAYVADAASMSMPEPEALEVTTEPAKKASVPAVASPYTMHPTVFAVEDGYEIIFHTDATGMAWEEVGGVKYTDSTTGLMDWASKYHQIYVPRVALDSARSYKLCFQSVETRKPYSPVHGSTVSRTYPFTPMGDKQEPVILCLSDFRKLNAEAQTVATYKSFDALYIGGDYAWEGDSEGNIKLLLSNCGTITSGTKPVIYTRGNRELRGAFSHLLEEVAPRSKSHKSYYTIEQNNLFAIVLDSGEDKADSHEDYGATIAYETYRSEQTQWLKEVLASGKWKDYPTRVAFCHIPFTLYNTAAMKKTFSEWTELLDQMGISLLISGNKYTHAVYPENSASHYSDPSFAVVVVSDVDHETYAYSGSYITLGQSTIKIESVSAAKKLLKTSTVNNLTANNFWKNSDKYLMFDFNNDAVARERYHSSVYGGLNYDLKSSWKPETNTAAPTITRGVLSFSPLNETITSSGLSSMIQGPTSGQWGNRALHYIPKSTDYCQVRFKIDDAVSSATNGQGIFRLDVDCPNDINDAADATKYYTRYQKSFVVSDVVGKGYTTLTFPLNSTDYMKFKWLNLVHPQFVNIKSASGATATFSIDYIYIGPQEMMPEQEDRIFIDFADAQEDRQRYDSFPYNYQNFDEPANWTAYNGSPLVSIADGAMRLAVTNGNTDTAFSVRSGVGAARVMHYVPGENDYIQVRIKIEDAVSTNADGTATFRMSLDRTNTIVGSDGTSRYWTTFSIHFNANEHIDKGWFVLETKLTHAEYLASDWINLLHPQFANLSSKSGKTAAFYIDYIYIGPREGLPTLNHMVTFCDENGTVLQSSKVLDGQAAAFVGQAPTKAYTDAVHYVFGGWKDAQGSAIDVTNVKSDLTLYPYFTEEAHTYAYTNSDAQMHNGICACGHGVAQEHQWDNGTVMQGTSCLEPGQKRYECLLCDAARTETIEASGHSYEAVVTAPDCDDVGYTTYICSVCNDTYIDQETAPLGHSEVIDEAVAATCTESGLTEGKHCSVCNEVLVAQTEVAALGHSEVIDEAVAPTCTEGGLTEGKHCSVCKEVLLAQTEIAALGHSYDNGVITVEPTCTVAGTKTFTCHCGDTQTEPIEKLNHKSTYVAQVAPTCTEDGLEAHYKCSRCEMTFVDEVCRYPLPVEYMVIPATGHSYTYTNNGDDHTVGCENCNDSATEDHTYIDGSCICGAEEVTEPTKEFVATLKPSMSIVVGAEMSVAFTVPNALVGKYESFYLVVEKDMVGAEPKTVTFGYGEGQTALTPMPNAANPFLHNASFTGLTAKEMGDEVRATLYGIGADGTLYYGPTQTDSIKSYLMRGLDLATSTPEKKTMYVDMLRYGAVAQTYFDYDTDNLVADDLTEEHLTYATTAIPEAVDGSKAEGGLGTLNTSVVLKARVTLTLSHLKPGANLANMKFIVKDALDGTVIKELPAYNLNPVMVAADFDDVGAKQMRRLITVTLYDGNTAITDTVTWSVESYVAKVRATSTDAGQIDLVNAMLTYGDAVAAYMATQ